MTQQSLPVDVPGLPTISDALKQAQALLDEDKDNQFQVNPDTLVPNPMQGLWIVSFESPTGESLDGGGIVVDEDGARYLTSAPDAIEYIGALFPDEEDEADDEEIQQVLSLYGNDDAEFEALLETFDTDEVEGLLQHFGFDPSQPRAEDGRWDPSGNGGEKKDKPMTEAQRRTALVKAILAALDDVLDQLSSKQAKALIEQIKKNAKAFIDGQERSGGGGGGGGKDSKGGKDSDGGGGGSKGGGGKDSKDSKDSGGSGGRPGGLEGVIAGVKSLIKNFGKNMKPNDRDRLQRAVDALE